MQPAVADVASASIPPPGLETGRPQIAYGSVADDDMREALGLPESAETDDDGENYSESIPDADVDARVIVAAAVVQPPPSSLRPRTNGYKPGTRQLNAKKDIVTGARPWWAAPRGDKVWDEKAEAFKAKGGQDTKNIIGWRDTGLTGGAGR